MKRSSLLILLLGDLLALLIFVFIGQADHQTLNTANPLVGAMPNFLPLAAAWLLLAALLGAFAGPTSLRGFMARSALAWLLAAPLGLLLRMVWLQRGGIPWAFLVVTLSAGGLLLLGWRLIAWRLWLRR
ncbi:MAG: DUF3054 family protein [Caldilineales bacterium]